MRPYVVTCCSTADLPKEYFDARKIAFAPFHCYFGDAEYPDDLGQSMPIETF